MLSVGMPVSVPRALQLVREATTDNPTERIQLTYLITAKENLWQHLNEEEIVRQLRYTVAADSEYTLKFSII